MNCLNLRDAQVCSSLLKSKLKELEIIKKFTLNIDTGEGISNLKGQGFETPLKLHKEFIPNKTTMVFNTKLADPNPRPFPMSKIFPDRFSLTANNDRMSLVQDLLAKSGIQACSGIVRQEQSHNIATTYSDSTFYLMGYNDQYSLYEINPEKHKIKALTEANCCNNLFFHDKKIFYTDISNRKFAVYDTSRPLDPPKLLSLRVKHFYNYGVECFAGMAARHEEYIYYIHNELSTNRWLLARLNMDTCAEQIVSDSIIDDHVEALAVDQNMLYVMDKFGCLCVVKIGKSGEFEHVVQAVVLEMLGQSGGELKGYRKFMISASMKPPTMGLMVVGAGFVIIVENTYDSVVILNSSTLKKLVKVDMNKDKDHSFKIDGLKLFPSRYLRATIVCIFHESKYFSVYNLNSKSENILTFLSTMSFSGSDKIYNMYLDRECLIVIGKYCKKGIEIYTIKI